MPPSPLLKLRKLCLALPESIEVEAWGAPTFRVKGKLFAMYSKKGDHKSFGRHGVWIKSDRENQQLMIRTDPKRFFFPPYVGPSGWIGVFIDEDPDWDEVKNLLRDGWRAIAPKKLVKATESSVPAPPAPSKRRAPKKHR